MEIKTARLILAIDGILTKRDAEKVRGYLGDIFWDNPLTHHHLPDGSLLYKYPKVQYKVIKGNCFVIGFAEGIQVVERIFIDIQNLFLSDTWKSIHSKSFELVVEEFSETINPIEYKFISPWLALNQNNYQKYRNIKNSTQKKIFLANILNANILSLAKSLDFTVKTKIHSEIINYKPVIVSSKNNRLLGFYANFLVNFSLPMFWGLGKSVSRGFGTLINENKFLQFKRELLNLFQG